MNRTKLPIRKQLENVMQSSESVDAAVAEWYYFYTSSFSGIMPPLPSLVIPVAGGCFYPFLVRGHAFILKVIGGTREWKPELGYLRILPPSAMSLGEPTVGGDELFLSPTPDQLSSHIHMYLIWLCDSRNGTSELYSGFGNENGMLELSSECFIYVLEMPKMFFSGSQGRVPVSSMSGSSELRAHNSLRVDRENIVTLFDSLRSLDHVDDLASTYHGKNVGEEEGENDDDLLDLFSDLDPRRAGPSRLGIGKGKDITRYKGVMRENAEVEVDKEEESKDEDIGEDDDNGDDDVDGEEVLSITYKLCYRNAIAQQ
ncbi:hypothetical protein AgCh_021471 [Apium graveolens]